MHDWAPRRLQRAALAEVEALLATRGESVDGRYARACCLRTLGRFAEAADDFARVLAAAPNDRDAAIASIDMSIALGRRREAQAATDTLAARDPADAGVQLTVGNVWSVDDPERARAAFASALAIEAGMEAAHRGLCQLAASDGDRERAAVHRACGYASGAVRTRPYYGDRAPIAALALVSTDGGNLAIDTLLDPAFFFTSEIAVEAFDAATPLPPHAVVLVAIGDVDRAPDAVAAAEAILARTTRPVVNAPASLAHTGRIASAGRLHGISGVRIPITVAFPSSRTPRDVASSLAISGITPPFILRSTGYHMGRNTVLARSVDEAVAAAAGLRGSLVAIEYCDTRVDPWFRKYRVIIAGGELLPLHLAVAPVWNVHYFSAPMREHDDFRREEARFLDDMPAVIGTRAMRALEAIRDTLALDYGGIDFALDRNGDIVVFEANAAMTVLQPDPDPIWDYRRPAAERVTVALRAMMIARAT